MWAVVRDRIRGKASGLRRSEELEVCLRALKSVGRCAKKMKIGIPTVDVSLRCPEENKDDSRAAEVRDGMKRRERRTETGGCCRRVRVRPARREQSRATKKKAG